MVPTQMRLGEKMFAAFPILMSIDTSGEKLALGSLERVPWACLADPQTSRILPDHPGLLSPPSGQGTWNAKSQQKK